MKTAGAIQLAPLNSWSFRVSAAPTRNWVAQYSYGRLEHPEALEPGTERRQTASVEYNRPFAGGNWATSLIWGRKLKEFDGTILNSYLLESTANFMHRNYAFTRIELVDKDELFPQAATHPSYRIGAYTFGGCPRPDTEPVLAVGPGRGCNALFEAGRAGRRVRGQSRVISCVLAGEAGTGWAWALGASLVALTNIRRIPGDMAIFQQAATQLAARLQFQVRDDKTNA